MTVWVGTSGWQYRHWNGRFYPGVSQDRWLTYFARRFATVEVNSTFYRLPEPKTFASWRRAVPQGFVMTVKASRYLTHNKKLLDPADPVAKLMAAASGLGDRLGPILVQLPPSLKIHEDRLHSTLAAFPKGTRVAVEFRNSSWYTDAVRQMLTEFDAALCLADRRGESLTPLWKTASWGYLRLHEGEGGGYRARYADSALDRWAGTVADLHGENDCFVYFNNDGEAAAIHDAVRFAKLAAGRGLVCTRVPTDLRLAS